MASLIESARTARQESERARLASRELRLAVRTNRRITQARTEKAVAAAAAARRQVELALPSPWSGLLWRHDDEQLERTLIPLD